MSGRFSSVLSEAHVARSIPAAKARIEHHGRPGVGQLRVVGRLERVLDRLLHVVVDRQLETPTLGGRLLVERAHLAAQAVDHHALGAVGAPQQGVVGLLEPRLADDVSRPERRIGGHHRVVHLADVSEEVGGQLVGRILPRRHLFHHDVGQFEVQAASPHGRDLRERRVIDDHDGPV